MRIINYFLMITLCLGLCTACASKDTVNPAPITTTSLDSEFEDYNDTHTPTIADPLEPWNRFWFKFNDVLLLEIIKPIYHGYSYITPQEFRTGLSNFYFNFKMPIRFANSLLQGRPGQAGYELGRFIVNTTIGFGGLIDVTKGKKPRYQIDEKGADFGQTLATWGIGEGIYLVWPLLGPSTIRDTIGLVGDYGASASFWAVEPIGPIEFWPALGVKSTLDFNDLGSAITAYEAITNGAIEPYIAAREAYVKYRRDRILSPAWFK